MKLFNFFGDKKEESTATVSQPTPSSQSTSNSKLPTLREIFDAHDGKLVNKWTHYFEVYDRHFAKYRGKECFILEVGVSHGGSLQMWRKFLGPKARIIGLDNNPNCKSLEEPGLEIIIGSQSDRNFLRQLKKDLPKFDILIDDGGHYMDQQIITYEELFDHVKDDGTYLCEDLHTSYWEKYGGGYKHEDSYIEYTKQFIDQINAFHSRTRDVYAPDTFTKTVNSIHYYDSMIVIEKRKRQKSEMMKMGYKTI